MKKLIIIILFPVLITAQENQLNDELIKKVFDGLRLHLLEEIMKKPIYSLMKIYILQLFLQMELL